MSRESSPFVRHLSTGTDPHRHTPGTHNHTHDADPSRARQARSGPSDPRSLPDPTDPPSEQASTTDHQPVLQPASPAPPARRESRPNPNPMRPFSSESPTGPPSIPFCNRSFKDGPTHTATLQAHTHSHTQTPTEQGRRGQACQTHEAFRTRPTRRASKRACEHVVRPLSPHSSRHIPLPPRGPRAGRIRTPSPIAEINSTDCVSHESHGKEWA